MARIACKALFKTPSVHASVPAFGLTKPASSKQPIEAYHEAWVRLAVACMRLVSDGASGGPANTRTEVDAAAVAAGALLSLVRHDPHGHWEKFRIVDEAERLERASRTQLSSAVFDVATGRLTSRLQLILVLGPFVGEGPGTQGPRVDRPRLEVFEISMPEGGTPRVELRLDGQLVWDCRSHRYPALLAAFVCAYDSGTPQLEYHELVKKLRAAPGWEDYFFRLKPPTAPQQKSNVAEQYSRLAKSVTGQFRRQGVPLELRRNFGGFQSPTALGSARTRGSARGS